MGPASVGAFFWVSPSFCKTNLPEIEVKTHGRNSTTSATPLPIPGGLQVLGPGTPVFHFFLPAPAVEPSTVTNFNPFSRTKVRDAQNGFVGDFVQNVAQIAWAGQTDTATFVSDPASTSVNEFSLLAHELNGVFFS